MKLNYQICFIIGLLPRSLIKSIRNISNSCIGHKGKRFHVWCAGCSIGMQVYSVAMIVLEWLSRR